MKRILISIALVACTKQPPPKAPEAPAIETIGVAEPMCEFGFLHLKLHASPSHAGDRERAFVEMHGTAHGHHAKALAHAEAGRPLEARDEFAACAHAYDGIADDDPNRALASESAEACTKNAGYAQQIADCKK